MVKKIKKPTYIVLYPEDFKKSHIWEDYCNLLGVSVDSLQIKINIKSLEVE